MTSPAGPGTTGRTAVATEVTSGAGSEAGTAVATGGAAVGGPLVGTPGPAPFVLLGDAAAGVCEDGLCAVPGTPPA
ncbi:hypothetical protein [Cellulomonas endophytica]|uniref:hypothetical protein n=1 Tax=Cellulomonas endophytica TaxID=2494735 RepID=UPI0013E97B6A|nr:hypothetical protein [Cellulomonas endophytica]